METMAPDSEQIIGRLTTEHIGRELHAFDVVESTNATAREAAVHGAPHGAVFTAREQSSGRGRFHRQWQSPPGGLWFSMVLRPGSVPDIVPLLPMAAGLALVSMLKCKYSLDADLAWPNDVTYRGKKLAGLLAEPRFRGGDLEFVILGMGVNVNNSPESMSPEIRDTVCCCKEILGREISVSDLLADFLNAFEPLYHRATENPDEIFSDWKKAVDLEGGEITVTQSGREITGVVAELCRDGAIVLDTSGGRVTVNMDQGSLHTHKYSKKI